MKSLFSSTHLKIAETINNTLEFPPLKIHKAAFQFGSIMPDLLLVNPDHVIEKSLSFIDALINELQTGIAIDASSAETQKFFVKLGIVCHYVADYFCHVHNDRHYKQVFYHAWYENRLRIEFNCLNLKQLSSIGLHALVDPNHLVDHIQANHQAYLAEKPDFSQDICYTMKITTVIIASILDNCKVSYLRRVA